MTAAQIGNMVNWLLQLNARDDIPNDERRDFNDGGVKRLMPNDLKVIVVNIKEGIVNVGYDCVSRFELVQLCKHEGITVRWAPTEQDNFGWLGGKLITKKGTFSFS